MVAKARRLRSSRLLSVSTSRAEPSAAVESCSASRSLSSRRVPEDRIGIDDARGKLDLAQPRAHQRAAIDRQLALALVFRAVAVEIGLHVLDAHRLQGHAQRQPFEAAQRRRQHEALDERARAAHLVADLGGLEADARPSEIP